MRVLSIANFKGGVGKTVTAVNMAAYLADSGFRVLLIDADPQHNCSDFYRIEEGPTLYDVLEGYTDLPAEAIPRPTALDNLSLLCSDMRLLTLDLGSIVNGSQSRVTARFADFVQALRSGDVYDLLIVDCPPSFTAASVAALMESDDVILPTRVDAWSRAGVIELIEQVRSLGRATAGTTFRVLITMSDRTNLARQGADLLRESGLDVFNSEIRRCVSVGESSYARHPLIEYAPKSTAARDYDALVQEYLSGAGEV